MKSKGFFSGWRWPIELGVSGFDDRLVRLSFGCEREKVTDCPEGVLPSAFGSKSPVSVGCPSKDGVLSNSSDIGEGVRGASGMGKKEAMVNEG